MEITRLISTGKISPWAKGIITQLEDSGQGTKIIEMSEDLYRKLCDKNDPSEMLLTAAMPNKALRDFNPRDLKLPQNPFILVLDRPSDTGNLGSIIRSANSFGVDAVLLLGHGVDPWDPKTIRASLGTIFYTVPLHLESLQELDEYIQLLISQYNIKVFGTDSSGAFSLASKTLKRPLMLILGNEAKGMSLALKDLCDGLISIPISGNVNSLNLASAASIFMWEVFRNSLLASP